MITNFIIVDDDPINNMLCELIITKQIPGATLHAFTDPVLAIESLPQMFQHEGASETILLLDINMPVLSGWEFLGKFEELSTGKKSKIKIFILSSSVDSRDKELASKNKNVLGYIEKPLTLEAIDSVITKVLIEVNT